MSTYLTFNVLQIHLTECSNQVSVADLHRLRTRSKEQNVFTFMGFFGQIWKNNFFKTYVGAPQHGARDHGLIVSSTTKER